MNIKLPLEFKNLYKQDGVSLREVLEGFIRDLCALDGSHVSDEREGTGVLRSLRLSVLERQVIAANRRPACRFAPAGFACPVPRSPLYCAIVIASWDRC
jgi:hypothetical protein